MGVFGFLLVSALCLLYSDYILETISKYLSKINPVKKCVLITGAGAGLGKATCHFLAFRGHKILAVDVNKEALETLKQQIPSLSIFTCDVTKTKQCMEIQEQVREVINREQGINGIHAIVNFAGINVLGPLLEMSCETFSALLDTNVLGTFNINQTFYPLLSEQTDFFPRIINLSSEVASAFISPSFTPYALTKIAVMNYSNQLRSELQLIPKGEPQQKQDYKSYAHIISFFPGPCETSMTQKGMMKRHLESYPRSLWKSILLKGSDLVDEYLDNGKIPTIQVAKAIEHMINVRKPLRNYSIGVSFSMRIAKYVPSVVQEAIFLFLLGSPLYSIQQIF